MGNESNFEKLKFTNPNRPSAEMLDQIEGDINASVLPSVQEIYRGLYTDSLTDLFNRKALTRDINKLEATKDSNPPRFIFIDLNLLKKTNDKYGHEAGDELLKRMSQALQDTFPGPKIGEKHGSPEESENENGINGKNRVYRNDNGDEFFVILDPDNQDSFESLLQKLQENADKLNQENPTKTPLSFAAAGAQFDPSLGDKNLFDTKNRADIEMQKNKDLMKQNDPSLER